MANGVPGLHGQHAEGLAEVAHVIDTGSATILIRLMEDSSVLVAIGRRNFATFSLARQVFSPLVISDLQLSLSSRGMLQSK